MERYCWEFNHRCGYEYMKADEAKGAYIYDRTLGTSDLDKGQHIAIARDTDIAQKIVDALNAMETNGRDSNNSPVPAEA